MLAIKQLETNIEDLRGMSAPRETLTCESRESIVFGIYDRLLDHGHAVINVAMAPALPDGSPNFGRADPANIEALPADDWPDNPQDEKRVIIVVDQIDGCAPETSMMLFFSDFGQPFMEQIAGPEADADIAMRIIGRDIGARPPESPTRPLQESVARLSADLAAWKTTPLAANDNKPSAAKPRERFSVDWFCDIDEDMPKEEILKGVFGEGEYTMVSGKPGSGKSVISTDIACHVAAGMEWHGRAVKQGLVVYIAAERKALTKRRMRAFKKRHGVDDIPLMVLGGMLDFTSGLADAKAVIAVIKAAEEVCGHKCVWIVVDTLTRTFGPGDQNTSKDMTKFVLACDTIREGVPGSHLTVIHHTGWAGDRGKGAIDLDGAVDASFLVKKEGRGYILECDGTNDGEEGVITHFKMEGVQVGEKDGEPTMAPVVVQVDGVSDADIADKILSGFDKQAVEALRGLSEDGEAVPMALWRTAYRNHYSDEERGTVDGRFNRAKDKLLKIGKISQSDGGFIVCE